MYTYAVTYVDEYMCRCTLINGQNFVFILLRTLCNFAYADKYICTCLFIKVIGPGSANFVFVDE